MMRLRSLLVLATVLLATVLAWRLTGGTSRGDGIASGGGRPPAASRPGSEAAGARRSSPSGRDSSARGGAVLAARGDRSGTGASASRPPGDGPFTAHHLSGRIVTRGERVPVPRARLRAEFVNAEGGTLGMADVAEADGTFQFFVPKGRFTWLDLELRSAKDSGVRHLEVAGPFDRSRDLGEIELGAFRTIAFRVLAADDAPIAAARARAVRGSSRMEETGSDGSGSIEVPEGSSTLAFAAAGFQPATVDAGPGQEPVTVRLRAAATLTIHVVTAGGQPDPSTTSVRIESEREPCEVRPWDPFWVAIGGTAPTPTSHGGLLFQSSTVRLLSMRSGVPVTVLVHESASDQHVREDLVLAEGERRELSVLLPGAFRRLRGRVVAGDAGLPIRGATVRLEISSPRLPKTTSLRDTDADGTFDFGAVFGGVADLSVSAPDRARWHRREQALDAVPDPLQIVLDPGSPVTVKVVDADGKAVKGASVYAADRFGVTGDDGQVVLEHLPPEELDVEAFYGGSGSARRAAAASTVTVCLAALRR